MTVFSIKHQNDKEARIVKKLFEKTIKDFMDIIILVKLRDEEAGVSGYDFISYVNDRFGFLVSSGSVYSLLYSLERNGLVKGLWFERKRVYRLTEKGTQPINTIIAAQDKIKGLLDTVFQNSETPVNAEAEV